MILRKQTRRIKIDLTKKKEKEILSCNRDLSKKKGNKMASRDGHAVDSTICTQKTKKKVNDCMPMHFSHQALGGHKLVSQVLDLSDDKL